MLVYGDTTFPLRRECVVGYLQFYGEDGSLASLRAGLILAGQWEQGVADSHFNPREWERITDAVSDAFLRRLSGQAVDLPPLFFPSTPVEVDVRVPEGYAFYALYPEQYAAAAAEWAAGRDRRGKVLVVGIRTIGTSLSAVVRAALQRLGFEAERVTVRPAGHPFERAVELPFTRTEAVHAIVVDEGPGLSGSSMAAAAEALVRMGVPEPAITFFTAHGGLPGRFASETVRGVWRRVARLSAGTREPVWDGLRLSEALASATMDLASGIPVAEVENLGQAPFGRPRLRVRLADGTAWVWKFYGLAAADWRGTPVDLGACERIDPGSHQSRPDKILHGWLASRWVEGRHITSEYRSLILNQRLGRHIRQRAEEPLRPEEHLQALERLRQMLHVNLREGLAPPEATRLLVEADRIQVPAGLPTAGDYRMGPEHWICTPHNVLVKVSGGRVIDHTLVGRQPFLWDLAGAAVEWELTPREQHQVAFVAGFPFDPGALRFYQVAYAAFRMGQCVIAEQPMAAGRYRRILQRLAHEA